MNIVCVICNDILIPSDNVVHAPCGHIFHRVCLVQWLKRSRICPQCGESTTEQDIHRIYISLKNQSVDVLDAITEFIIMDLQSPEIVEGHGFQRLVTTLRSPCEIPSKNKLEKEISRKCENLAESVTNSLSCASELALTIEEWRSNNDENFVTFSVYYQNNEEATLEYKILNTLHVPLDWKESHWENIIDRMVSDLFLDLWDLNIERITAVVVSSSRKELLDALTNHDLIVVPCLLHTLQVCAQACFENPEVAQALSKFRLIIGEIMYFPDVYKNYKMLTVQEQLSELNKIVWLSTYTMLEKMIIHRDFITELIDLEMYGITNEQWKIIEDIVKVLKPFKVTIMTLSKQKILPVSLVKPLLSQLIVSHLKVEESDSDTAKTLKESLSDMLYDRYSDYNVKLLLQIATTLDPRFKTMACVTEEDKSAVSTLIREMLTTLIQKESGDVPIKTEDEAELEFLFGSLCTTQADMPPEEKADLEIIQYQSEPMAPLNYCPLQWWSEVSAKCPNLAKLVSKYHCVPACCAPPSRIPLDIQIQYHRKRAALPHYLIDKLLFLHGNHTMQV